MEENSALIINDRPKLRSPYFVCAFNGWLNGGNVPVGGITYLISHLKATKFAEMRTSHFHVYSVSGSDGLRPIFKMEEGLITETSFPIDHFYYARNQASDHDLVLLLGSEPNLYWEEYADTVVNLAHDFGASRLYAFGAVLESSPYFREPGVSCACTSLEIKNEMAKYKVGFSSREGSATFNQMLLYACQKKGLEGANLTARAPYYPEYNLAIEYSPRSIKAVLVRLSDIMHLRLSFDELEEQIKALEGKLDSFRQQNIQFNAYIQELDKDYVETPYQGGLDISGNEAVRLAEEFLRKNKDRPEGQ